MLDRMDERLRALARLAGDDEGASWARLRAVARSRSRRDLILELGRLARGGDPAAREALEGWSPLRPVPLEPRPRAGGWTSTGRVIDAGWLDPAAVLALGGGLAIAHRAIGQGWGRVSALALDEGERPVERWVSDTGGIVAWRGEDLVHTSPRSRAGGVLVAREATSGEVVARTEVKDRVASLSISGERGLLRTGDPRGRARLACFDASDQAFGRELWSRDLPFGTGVRWAGPRVVELDDAAVRGLDADTGRVVWERGADALGDAPLEHALALAVDDHLVLHASRDEQEDATTVCLDPTSGDLRWARRHGWHATPVSGGGRLIFGEVGARLLAFELIRFEPVWEASSPGAAAGALRARTCARAAVFAGAQLAPPSGPLVRHDALVLDPRDGVALATGALHAPSSANVTALVADGWAAVVASASGRLAWLEFTAA